MHNVSNYETNSSDYNEIVNASERDTVKQISKQL